MPQSVAHINKANERSITGKRVEETPLFFGIDLSRIARHGSVRSMQTSQNGYFFALIRTVCRMNKYRHAHTYYAHRAHIFHRLKGRHIASKGIWRVCKS